MLQRHTGLAQNPHKNVPALALCVLLVLCIGLITVLVTAPLTPLSRHMSTHILLMNLAAPGLALSAHAFSRAPIRASAKFLFVATAMQIAALWIAHSPPVVAASMQSFAIHVLIHAMLLASALSFWVSILSQDGTARWRAILALLATGKLFCLLAALLVFAPRALYPTHAGHGDQMVAAADLLSDQQLAGLLMLVICPLTYVFAGVLIAERWLSELRRRDAGIEPVR